jgi:thymidylate kinase
MKRLILILGPNGVGKSTVSTILLSRMPGSAYIESDTLRMINPGTFNEEAIFVQKRNMLSLMRNYMSASFINDIIFPYGLHGHRKRLLDEILSELHSDYEFDVYTILLTCTEEENIRRMKNDGRDEERIRRALANTRAIYDDLDFPRIDATGLTPDETAEHILKVIK